MVSIDFVIFAFFILIMLPYYFHYPFFNRIAVPYCLSQVFVCGPPQKKRGCVKLYGETDGVQTKPGSLNINVSIKDKISIRYSIIAIFSN